MIVTTIGELCTPMVHYSRVLSCRFIKYWYNWKCLFNRVLKVAIRIFKNNMRTKVFKKEIATLEDFKKSRYFTSTKTYLTSYLSL